MVKEEQKPKAHVSYGNESEEHQQESARNVEAPHCPVSPVPDGAPAAGKKGERPKSEGEAKDKVGKQSFEPLEGRRLYHTEGKIGVDRARRQHSRCDEAHKGTLAPGLTHQISTPDGAACLNSRFTSIHALRRSAYCRIARNVGVVIAPQCDESLHALEVQPDVVLVRYADASMELDRLACD